MRRLLFFITGLVLVLSPFLLSARSGKTIRLLTDNRPPFEFAAPDGTVDGIAVRIIRCILDNMDRPYRIELTSWKRAQQNVRDGKADGFFAASRNDDRDQYAVLSDITCDQYWNWYHLKSRSMDPARPSFKEMRFSSWLGSNSLNWLRENGYNVVAAPVGAEMLVKQLLQERVDVIFGSNVTIEASIRKLDAGSRIHVKRGLHKPMGVYFSKKFLSDNPGFLDRFNRHAAACTSH